MMVFDSEENARSAGDRVRAAAESSDDVTLDEVEVREVVASAWRVGCTNTIPLQIDDSSRRPSLCTPRVLQYLLSGDSDYPTPEETLAWLDEIDAS
jgi:hypothetical protein